MVLFCLIHIAVKRTSGIIADPVTQLQSQCSLCTLLQLSCLLCNTVNPEDASKRQEEIF